MRVTLREAALLALPTLSNAVSLSDMTPRATGLPPMCEAVYTSQIYGCSAQDFQTNQCSSSCVNALYGIAQAISHACAGQGVTGQNLVVAFLAGVGPQQLCHNAGDSSEKPGPPTSFTQPPRTHWSPTIGSSTTTARKATGTKSLLIDTSSTMTATIIPHRTQTTSSSSKPAQTTSKTTPIAEHTTATHSPTAGSATSSAAGDSQTSLNDHSGGGSPFDTPGNMNAASGVSLSLGSMILSAAAAMLMALR
jgi:hypothetical protein